MDWGFSPWKTTLDRQHMHDRPTCLRIVVPRLP